MKLQRVYSFVGTLSCVALTASCNPQGRYAPDYPPQNSVCEYFSKTEEIIPFWLGILPLHNVPDVKYHLPIEYFDSFHMRVARDGRFGGSLHIRFRISDFAPYHQDRTPIGLKEEILPYATLGLKLLKDLNRDFEIFARLNRDEVRTLLSEMPQAAPGDVLPMLSRPTGDLFYDYEGEKITAMILCNRQPGQVPGQERIFLKLSCQEYSDEGHIGFRLSYRKDRLPERKKIKADALEFINCAFVKRRK